LGNEKLSELTCNFEGFKRMCKEVIDAAPDLDIKGLTNAVKCLNLAFLNFDGTDLEILQATYAREVTLNAIHAGERLAEGCC
jgi:hypothetical protein